MVALSNVQKVPMVSFGLTWFVDDNGASNQIWTQLEILHFAEDAGDDPWLLFGDLNAIIDHSEVCSHAGDQTTVVEDFKKCVIGVGLLTLLCKELCTPGTFVVMGEEAFGRGLKNA
ncbi:hypothetical protein Salat_2522100 [Sesamum alatum]|uniref:Uncharacterized protein n=1 Tax=Sesamum alatum TaxID=300844 RepID=A0AAE1XS62_9LAMI|nr:hypothetical protein Salat_2522100 [Sesamum alatum]